VNLIDNLMVGLMINDWFNG